FAKRVPLLNDASRWRTRLGLEIACDQARPSIESKIGPRPIKEYYQPVPETHQENNVHKQPRQPCRQSAEMHQFEIRHGFVPSDCCHASLIEIVKSLRRLPPNHSQNVARGVTPLLHRDR